MTSTQATRPATDGAQATLLLRYLDGLAGRAPDPAAAAFYASLDAVGAVAPEVAGGIIAEFRDQRRNLKLIASENYSSLATQLAMGNLFSDKYAEGYPDHRFYAGCDNVDTIESLGASLARELFGAEYAYLQPHSGADANLVAFSAILSARVQAPSLAELGLEDPSKATREQWATIREAYHNQRLLALDYYSGGHLTHGYRHNISSQLFDVYSYAVDRETKLLDMEQIRKTAHEVPADHPPGRLQRLPAPDQLPRDARDCRRDRRGLHGRYGALRRTRRGQGLHRRLRPGRARTDRHHHDPQDLARAARRDGAGDRGVCAVGR